MRYLLWSYTFSSSSMTHVANLWRDMMWCVFIWKKFHHRPSSNACVVETWSKCSSLITPHHLNALSWSFCFCFASVWFFVFFFYIIQKTLETKKQLSKCLVYKYLFVWTQVEESKTIKLLLLSFSHSLILTFFIIY